MVCGCCGLSLVIMDSVSHLSVHINQQPTMHHPHTHQTHHTLTYPQLELQIVAVPHRRGRLLGDLRRALLPAQLRDGLQELFLLELEQRELDLLAARLGVGGLGCVGGGLSNVYVYVV